MLLRRGLGQDDRCSLLHRLRMQYSAVLLLLRGRLFLLPLLLHSLLPLLLPRHCLLCKLLLGLRQHYHNHRTLHLHTTLLLILGPGHQSHRRSNHLRY